MRREEARRGGAVVGKSDVLLPTTPHPLRACAVVTRTWRNLGQMERPAVLSFRRTTGLRTSSRSRGVRGCTGVRAFPLGDRLWC